MPKFLDKLANAADKLANAGAGSRMPDAVRGHVRDQSVNTNARNDLAEVAANLGASRVARKAAEKQLADAVGAREAAQLIKGATHKARTSFRSGR